MAKKATVKESPVECPQCGADMTVEDAQRPENIIKANNDRGANPMSADRFAKKVQEKADKVGAVYYCPSCDYRMRVKAAA